MLDPLSALAVKYGSDKWSAKHSYTKFYYDTFKDRRASVRKVVEIGVGEGASLRMWREFFPNAMIYGAEILPNRVWSDERIQIIEFDQTKQEDLEGLTGRTGGAIDLFVDDGTHVPDDQITTCLVLMPYLWRGVTYVIEDVRDRGVHRMLGDYAVTEPKLERRLRYDNRLAVVTYPNA